MLKADKERIVAELAEQLGAADTLIVADYRGLTNKQLEALRDVLLEHGARFRIVKNTLTRQAAERAGVEALLVMLEGPTAIAFIESSGDPAAVAKALAATAKETNVLALRGGILEGNTLSGEDVAALATLPPVDVLRGQLVGAIVAPVTQLVALLSAPLRDLHGLLQARIEQLEAEGQVVESDEAQAEAEPAHAEATEAEPAEADAAEDDAASEDAPAEESDEGPAASAEPGDGEEQEAAQDSAGSSSEDADEPAEDQEES